MPDASEQIVDLRQKTVDRIRDLVNRDEYPLQDMSGIVQDKKLRALLEEHDRQLTEIVQGQGDPDK